MILSFCRKAFKIGSMSELKPTTITKKKNKEIRLAMSDLLMALGFILAMGVLCFTLGVRLGKKQAISDYERESVAQKIALEKKANLLEKMREKIIEKSDSLKTSDLAQVEMVDRTNNTGSEPMSEVEQKTVEVKKKNIFSKPEVDEKEPEVKEDIVIAETTKTQKELKPSLSSDPLPFLESGNPALSSSYTIIIGDFIEYEEASLFAQAFKERGYRPFLQKYSKDGIDKIRVSLGSYTSEEKAQKFLLEKSDIFTQGKYKISKFL